LEDKNTTNKKENTMKSYWEVYYEKLDACKTTAEAEALKDDEYYAEEAQLYAEHSSTPPARHERKIGPGYLVRDEAGRIGVITEVREDGYFIRPANTPYKIDDIQGITDVDNAIILTPTYWNLKADGSLRGLWWDSAPNAFTSCRVVGL
jgi:hypothetical protein